MKTAEEAADYLAQQLRWYDPDNKVLESDRADIIRALNNFAKQRVNDAYEKAAKICDKRQDERLSELSVLESIYIAEEIRALKK